MSTHGLDNTYKRGCRCQACTDAHCVEKKRWQLGYTGRLVDSTGTKRRVHALVALGWTLAEIAADCGKKSGSAWTNEVLRADKLHSKTESLIRASYAKRCMTVPHGPYRNRQRISAARKGYAPPLAWDDDTIDDPDALPAGVGFTPAPRAETLAELDHLGAGISNACQRLQVSRDALEKWCERNDMSAIYGRLVDRESMRFWANQFTEGGVA